MLVTAGGVGYGTLRKILKNHGFKKTLYKKRVIITLEIQQGKATVCS